MFAIDSVPSLAIVQRSSAMSCELDERLEDLSYASPEQDGTSAPRFQQSALIAPSMDERPGRAACQAVV